jgi:ribonuclease P/MRP protein subunit POP8
VPRQDARVLRASLSTWAGSCDADGVPGVDAEEGRRVRVAWRVVGEAGTVLGGCCGDGSGMFGG